MLFVIRIILNGIAIDITRFTKTHEFCVLIYLSQYIVKHTNILYLPLDLDLTYKKNLLARLHLISACILVVAFIKAHTSCTDQFGCYSHTLA
jgi:hypothetical protein